MKKLPKEDRAGLYITLSIHLIVIIILLVFGIKSTISKSSDFMIDFSKLEEIEKLQKEIAFKEAVSKRLEQMIAEQGGRTSIKNVAVAKGALKDDRGTDAEKLYADAERLQQDLNRPAETGPDEVTVTKKPTKEEKTPEHTYTGPSVLSYELEGRKASRLPIPAYRCLGGGEVKVIIWVNTSGDVIGSKIDESCSSTDGCLREYALRAASLSRFSANPSAPSRQQGCITYLFIAQ